MSKSRLSLGVRLLGGAAIFLTLPTSAAAKPPIIRGSPTPTVTIFATGFNNPRNLRFGLVELNGIEPLTFAVRSQKWTFVDAFSSEIS